MKMQVGKSATRVDIAIDGDTLSAVLQTGGATRLETVAWSLPSNADEVPAALQHAFEQLAARVRDALGRDTRGLHVGVALLPPLAEVRLVALPPLRHAETEAIIRRDVARHFVGGVGSRVVAVRAPSPARRRGDSAPVLAAAAPTHVAEAIRTAAQRVGWTVVRIAPAHGAWIAAAERSARRSSAGAPIAVIATLGETAHVVRLERGAVTLLRRMRVSNIDEITTVLGSGPGAVSVFADGDVADAIARALAVVGWTVVRGPTAAQVAAAGARDASLELVPTSVLAEQEQRWRTLASRLAVAALVLIVLSAGLYLWGAQRELAAVRAQRAALRPQVAPLLETRDSLDRLQQLTGELRSLDPAAKWTRALFDIALLLPADAYLTSVRGTGDTLVIAGEGARAGAALQALRGATSLENVRLQGPVERDLEDGTTTLERFTLMARMVADTAARRTP